MALILLQMNLMIIGRVIQPVSKENLNMKEIYKGKLAIRRLDKVQTPRARL